jgi:hypothetical protein
MSKHNGPDSTKKHIKPQNPAKMKRAIKLEGTAGFQQLEINVATGDRRVCSKIFFRIVRNGLRDPF